MLQSHPQLESAEIARLLAQLSKAEPERERRQQGGQVSSQEYRHVDLRPGSAIVNRGTWSEADSRTELNRPGAVDPIGRNDLAREYAKVSRAVQTQRGCSQVDVVKHIEEVE